MKYIVISITSLLILAFACYGDENVLPKINLGFEAYSKKDAEAAYTAWGLELEKDRKKKFLEKLSKALTVYGDCLGYEIIRSDDYGTRYKVIHILARHKNRPLFFTFYCYRPEDKWKILALKFSGTTEFMEVK